MYIYFYLGCMSCLMHIGSRSHPADIVTWRLLSIGVLLLLHCDAVDSVWTQLLMGLAFSITLATCVLKSPKAYPRPPGPSPLFLIGNIRDLTTKELWLKADEWKRRYGPVCFLHVFGQGIVFLNTPEACADLLSQRIYSDRPQLTMLDMCGCNEMVAFTPYGDKSKRQRRLMHAALGPQSILKYQPLLLEETRCFLQRLVQSPEDYTAHIKRYSGGMVLRVLYGYEVTKDDDALLKIAEDCLLALSNEIASTASVWACDLFPFLRHIPLWMPGSDFKAKAILWKAQIAAFVEVPYAMVMDQIDRGVALPSFCKTLLTETGKKNINHSDISWTTNSMFSASMDTINTVCSQFILAMVMHPDVLARAQSEIDHVIGRHRLPEFSDRSKLPFIDCVMSESLRWGVPVPLNLPHVLTQDDVYSGYAIPKGSFVFANVWSIMRDETLYAKPNTFNPDRFMKTVSDAEDKKRDPRTYVFGFGRRRCPGVHLVESSVWILIASMIATLNFKKTSDSSGAHIEPEIRFENAVFRAPTPFQCVIELRSEEARKLLESRSIVIK